MRTGHSRSLDAACGMYVAGRSNPCEVSLGYSNLTAITVERVETVDKTRLLTPKCRTAWTACIHISCMDAKPRDS